MARPEDISAFQPDPNKHARLWKAQRVFTSAELLRDNERFDCAANRYYYATFHAATAFVGEGYLKHPALWEKYSAKQRDPQAFSAMSRASQVRETADYTPVPVTAKQLALIVIPVAKMIVRAMNYAGVQRGAKEST